MADRNRTQLPPAFAAGILVGTTLFGLAVVAVLVIFTDTFLRSELEPGILRAPGFDDVSAFTAQDIRRIDAWLSEQVDLARYPSLSVAIVSDGEIVYQEAFGFEDIKAGREATPETSYHVASVTKAFTASLAVMLHDLGVVALDQPVGTYLPREVAISTDPELGATITLRQLASHTSGLPRDVPGRVQSVEGRYQLEPDRLYRHLAKVRLNFDPGTDEEYSNLGFGLLGRALERATGKPYDQLLKEMLCEPLHLARTGIQPGESFRPATGYGSEVPRRAEAHSHRRRLAPSGGLISSAPDLARFLSAHMAPGFLSKGTLEQLHAAGTLSDDSPSEPALGWSVRSRVSTGPILKKNGGRNNCSAWIGFAPAHKVGVAVLTNCGGPEVDPIGYWLLERSVPGGLKLVTESGYAKVAPYTGVRWENKGAIVCVQGRWSALVSIDGLPLERIMEFARQRFGEKAKQRLAEDLVELLSAMGHEPEWEVTLGLEMEDGRVEPLKVRMTEENRDLVRKGSPE